MEEQGVRDDVWGCEGVCGDVRGLVEGVMMGRCGCYLVHFCSTKNISSAMLDVIPSGLQVSMVTACKISDTDIHQKNT